MSLLSFNRTEVTLPSLGSGIISLLAFKRFVTRDVREFCTYVKLAVAEKTFEAQVRTFVFARICGC